MNAHPRDLAAEFKRLGPWSIRFVIDRTRYGGDIDPWEDERVDQFFDCFPAARSILELGSHEGGHTLRLSRLPDVARVLAIEGRQPNIDKARFALGLLGVENVEFRQANLECLDLSSLGRFDAVFCSGLLYHLPRPWELLQQLPAVSNRLFLWTHYANDIAATLDVDGYRGSWHQEGDITEPLSGLSNRSFWPSLESLFEMLIRAEFINLQILGRVFEPSHAPSITIAATTRGFEAATAPR